MNLYKIAVAAKDFVDKVDRGEARSIRSYKAFKDGLMAHDHPIRRSGRTSALALEYVSRCVDKAGVEIVIIDHHRPDGRSHQEDAIRLTKLVTSVLDVLGIPYRVDDNMVMVEPLK